MNGFPYGNFHKTRVKDHVHSPDWTTDERVAYTNRLFDILACLVPQGMAGGVSTNPISYRRWFTAESFPSAKKMGTENMIQVIQHLIMLHHSTGLILHLDVEPEPDGVMETGVEFIEWFNNNLLPTGIPLIMEKWNVSTRKS